MADGHGGARTPATPAPVSGPGRYSKRTDGGPAQVLSAPSNLDYGEKKALLNQQRVQPMAGTTPVPNAPVQAQGGAPEPQTLPQFAGTGIGEPTERPNEPITAGVNIGAGPNSLNLPTAPNPAQGTGSMTALLQKYATTDTTGIMGQLMMAAQARGA